MSIKENVDYIKEELSTQEQFLTGFVKLERFFKKYKVLLLSAVVVIILAIIGGAIKSYLDEQNIIKSNIAFNKFLENPNDEKALEEIKNTNTPLYEVALFVKSKSSKIDEKLSNSYLKALLDYKNALANKNTQELQTLSSNANFLLKDFALFDKAVILANEQKYQEARDTLKLINADSQIKDLVIRLEHYLIAK